MRKILLNKLFLLYFSKGITFISNYLLIIILFNQLPDAAFSSYSAITYYTFIIYTILDFGYSNYVILNKEINSNDGLLTNLHQKKILFSFAAALGFLLAYLITHNLYCLLVCVIAVQQAFNFDGLFKIKNNYQIIIKKYFLTALTNAVLIVLVTYFTKSYVAVVLYTYGIATIVNMATLPKYVKLNILNFKGSNASAMGLKSSDVTSLCFYFSFNFLSNFTYAYYAYAIKNFADASYYNNNILYLSLVSNFYVFYIICREYFFTTGKLNPKVVNIAVTMFVFIGCFTLYNYNIIVSLFGKTNVMESIDKLIACAIFLTLIAKTETFFRLLKNIQYLKAITIVQVVVNAVLFTNIDALSQRFGTAYILLPLVVLDVCLIALSIAAISFVKRFKTFSFTSYKAVHS